MAYDLMTGNGIHVKDNPTIIAGIEFDEYPAICSLLKKVDSHFLNLISNLFEDQKFGREQLITAQKQLLDMMPMELKTDELNLLYKLISVVSYALVKEETLFGVAD